MSRPWMHVNMEGHALTRPRVLNLVNKTMHTSVQTQPTVLCLWVGQWNLKKKKEKVLRRLQNKRSPMYSGDAALGSHTFINVPGSSSSEKLVPSFLDPTVIAPHDIYIYIWAPVKDDCHCYAELPVRFHPLHSQANKDTDFLCMCRPTATWRQMEEAGRSCRDALTAALTSTVRGRSTKRYKWMKSRGNSYLIKLCPRLQSHSKSTLHCLVLAFQSFDISSFLSARAQSWTILNEWGLIIICGSCKNLHSIWCCILFGFNASHLNACLMPGCFLGVQEGSGRLFLCVVRGLERLLPNTGSEMILPTDWRLNSRTNSGSSWVTGRETLDSPSTNSSPSAARRKITGTWCIRHWRSMHTSHSLTMTQPIPPIFFFFFCFRPKTPKAELGKKPHKVQKTPTKLQIFCPIQSSL